MDTKKQVSNKTGTGTKAKNPYSGFTRQELSVFQELSNPYKLQDYVNKLQYNTGKRLAPLRVLREQRADCVEAAVFACAVFNFHKIPNYLVDLASVRDEDHLLCVYKIEGLYGAIAQSKFLGLSFRNPVYQTIRELVMSYFEHYFNFYGELTLRKYSSPLKLPLSDSSWMYEDREIYRIEKQTTDMKHFSIRGCNKRLPLIPETKYIREIIILPKNVRVGKKYRETVAKHQQP